jgi:hypothetical protein
MLKCILDMWNVFGTGVGTIFFSEVGENFDFVKFSAVPIAVGDENFEGVKCLSARKGLAG